MALVRVVLPTGKVPEVSLSQAYVDGLGKDSGVVVLKDEPATNSRGALPASRKNGRRALPRTTVKKAATKKAAASKKADSSPATDTSGGNAVTA